MTLGRSWDLRTHLALLRWSVLELRKVLQFVKGLVPHQRGAPPLTPRERNVWQYTQQQQREACQHLQLGGGGGADRNAGFLGAPLRM